MIINWLSLQWRVQTTRLKTWSSNLVIRIYHYTTKVAWVVIGKPLSLHIDLLSCYVASGLEICPALVYNNPYVPTGHTCTFRQFWAHMASLRMGRVAVYMSPRNKGSWIEAEIRQVRRRIIASYLLTPIPRSVRQLLIEIYYADRLLVQSVFFCLNLWL